MGGIRKKDAYTGRLIEHFGELEIDHIIPQSTPGNVLIEKIALYGLGPTFTIHSIENLLPTLKGYNRQKADISFNESSERYFLGIAHGKSNRVRTELSKAIQRQKQKEKIQFKKSHQITDVEQYGFKSIYFHSDSLVALNAYLPSIYDEKGSCAIEFYEMGTMITLNHELILSLVEGYKENVLEEMILNYYNETNDKVFVIIGTSSLHFKREAYDQLLTILNDFLQEYDRYMKRFVQFWHLENFEPFENKEQYRLMEIEQSDWEYLIAYTCQSDVDRREADKIIFHANKKSLVAIEQEPPIIKFYVSKHTSSSNKVLLLWHLPKKEERKICRKRAGMACITNTQLAENSAKQQKNYKNKVFTIAAG